MRVVLADDNVLLREGGAALLERQGFEIAGQAGDAAGLLALVRAQQPDLVVVDIRMRPGHSTEGLDGALTIRKEFPETGIVVLSAFAYAEHAVELLSSGQRIGYLLKDRVADVTEFVQSLRRVVAGDMVIDPAPVQDLVRTRHGHDPLDVPSARGGGDHVAGRAQSDGHDRTGLPASDRACADAAPKSGTRSSASRLADPGYYRRAPPSPLALITVGACPVGSIRARSRREHARTG